VAEWARRSAARRPESTVAVTVAPRSSVPRVAEPVLGDDADHLPFGLLVVVAEELGAMHRFLE